MIKSFTKTCVSGTTFVQAVELGFVPDRVTIRNQTQLTTLVWTADTDTKAYITTATGSTSFDSVGAITVIDGSDKTNYTSYSYGFLLPAAATINDTHGEVLDITASRNDI